MPGFVKPLLAAAVFLAAASAALAEPDGPPPRDFVAVKAQHDRDLALLLHVTPAQEEAFRAFVDADGPPHPPGPPPAPDATLTTPQILDRVAAMEAERRIHIDQKIAATRALYAQLAPDQRQEFDALMRLRSLPKPPQPHGGPPGRPPGGPPPTAPH